MNFFFFVSVRSNVQVYVYLGDFQIEVFQDDIPIDDNEYIARAFDVNKVLILDFPTTSMVDASTYFMSR